MKFSGYKIDIWILLPVILLMMFSIGAVYSASSYFSMDKFNDSNYMLKHHSLRVLLALLMIFLFTRIDFRIYKDIGKYLIWISILALIFIFIFGVSTVKGASRWINLGPLSFQPADLAKFTLIIYLSALLVKKKNYAHMLYKGYLPLIFYILVVSGLVALQPNFSTAFIIFGTSVMLLLISPVKIKHIIITLFCMIPVAVSFILSKSYIVGRLTSHADYASGGSSNYQLRQALLGFGNGGFFGVGPGNSMQREYFLPEAYGDFIYAIVGEEYGFIGAFTVLVLFMIILVRGLKVSKMIKDEFGKYLSFGITMILSFYAVVNMSVACGLIPTTGVPIPFVSYGGTALLFNSIGVGILLNISSYRNETDEEMINEGNKVIEINSKVG